MLNNSEYYQRQCTLFLYCFSDPFGGYTSHDLSSLRFFFPFFILSYLHTIMARFIAIFSTHKKQTKKYLSHEETWFENRFIAFVISKVHKQHHKSTDYKKLKVVFLHKVTQILINYLPIIFPLIPLIKHRLIKFILTFLTSTFYFNLDFHSI